MALKHTAKFTLTPPNLERRENGAKFFPEKHYRELGAVRHTQSIYLGTENGKTGIVYQVPYDKVFSGEMLYRPFRFPIDL